MLAYARGLGAHLALREGDTTGAVARLGSLSMRAHRDQITWTIGPPQPFERLLLAELLLRQRDYRAAYLTATVFDHQGPVAFLPFVAPSLVLRLRAARAMGRPDLERRMQDRLRGLGRVDLLDRENAPQPGGNT